MLIANYVAKCQMSFGPYGTIFPAHLTFVCESKLSRGKSMDNIRQNNFIYGNLINKFS